MKRMTNVLTCLQVQFLVIFTLFDRISLVLGGTIIKNDRKIDSIKEVDDCNRFLKGYCIEHSSCDNVCGKSQLKKGTQRCSCDYLCLVYKDCCFDFEKKCPHEYDKFNKSELKHLVNVKSQCFGPYMALTTCFSKPPGIPKTNQSSINDNSKTMEDSKLNSTINQTANSSSIENDETASTSNIGNYETASTSSIGNDEKRYNEAHIYENHLLVTDTRYGLTYMNKDVYRCNNPEVELTSLPLIKWSKGYTSLRPVVLEDLAEFLTNGTSSEAFLKALYDVPPKTTVPRFCSPGIILQCEHICTAYKDETISNVNNICDVLYTDKTVEIENVTIHGIPFEPSFEDFVDGIPNFGIISDPYSDYDFSDLETDNGQSLSNLKESPIEVKPEEDSQCQVITIYKSTNGFIYNSFLRFSALLELDSKTKIFSVDRGSLHLSGGWDQVVCEAKPGKDKCEVVFACNQQSAYIQNQCLVPQSILVIIRSTNDNIGHNITKNVWFRFAQGIKQQNTLDSDMYQVINGTSSETVGYILMKNPSLFLDVDRNEKYKNSYGDVIEKIIRDTIDRGQWQGTVTTCYLKSELARGLKYILSLIKYNDVDIYCEDFLAFKNHTKPNDAVPEMSKEKNATSMATSAFIHVCSGVFVVVSIIAHY